MNYQILSVFMKMTPDYLPEYFDVCYFEMQMGFNCLHLDGNVINIDPSESEETAVPSKVEWERFWDKMEEIGLWDWEEDYEKCCMVDGYSWTIKITKGPKSIDSSGMNVSPTYIIGDQTKSSLEDLLDALEDLTGFRLDKGA
jgi:hypothetical protein